MVVLKEGEAGMPVAELCRLRDRGILRSQVGKRLFELGVLSP